MLVKIRKNYFINDNKIDSIKISRESDFRIVDPKNDFYTLKITLKDDVAKCYHNTIEFNYKTLKEVTKKFEDLFSLYK